MLLLLILYVEIGGGDGEEIVVSIVPRVPSPRGEVVEGVAVIPTSGNHLRGTNASAADAGSVDATSIHHDATRTRGGGRRVGGGV